MWNVPETKDITRTTSIESEKLKLVSEGCGPKSVCILSSLLDFIELFIFTTSMMFLIQNFSFFFGFIGLICVLLVVSEGSKARPERHLWGGFQDSQCHTVSYTYLRNCFSLCFEVTKYENLIVVCSLQNIR